jgi:hypothetical protein
LSLTLFLFVGFVAALLAVLIWAVREPHVGNKVDSGPHALEEIGQRHVNYLSQIRQALGRADYDFLSKRASQRVLRRVRRERRNIACAYLDALRGNFQDLLRMASAIAVLSPEVAAIEEFERLRLTISFSWRYQIIRWKLWVGWAPAAQLEGLSNLVSGLSVRMEAALKELGERAALAAELASSVDRSGLDAG